MAESLVGSLQHFRKYWKGYLFQSSLTGLVIFFIFAIIGFNREVIVASIGATSFIVFCLPTKFTANPRNVIGGHFVGLICGLVGSELNQLYLADNHLWYAFFCAFSVFLAAFLMVLFDVEHPPAAGTALGVALGGFTPLLGIVLLAIVISLSILRFLLKKYLVDLA